MASKRIMKVGVMPESSLWPVHAQLGWWGSIACIQVLLQCYGGHEDANSDSTSRDSYDFNVPFVRSGRAFGAHKKVMRVSLYLRASRPTCCASCAAASPAMHRFSSIMFACCQSTLIAAASKSRAVSALTIMVMMHHAGLAGCMGTKQKHHLIFTF